MLTNHALAERSGTELWVRDVCLELLRRGHEPIAYSRRLGEVAAELRSATIPVVDDLEQLGRAPDVIHAQHHLEAMTALARFPQTSAIYLCHGWQPDEEAPPHHPRILRYGAVSELVLSRLIDEAGVPAERTSEQRNFVDLRRFRPRGPLPTEPKRALVLSNHVSEENCLDALRAACLRAGLDLDVVGRDHGTASAEPESLLGDYDIVFAKGRSALEAAAVGAAVVLCDTEGIGPMVQSRNLEALRAVNCGVSLLQDRVTADLAIERIERYDPEDAADVCRQVRATASLGDRVDSLLALYEEVADEGRRTAFELDAHSRAVARYLRHGPLTGGDLHSAERERLLAEAAHQKGRAAELRRAADSLFAEKTVAAGAAETLRVENARLTVELSALETARSELESRHQQSIDRALELEQTIRDRDEALAVAETDLAERESALELERAQRRDERLDLEDRLRAVETARSREAEAAQSRETVAREQAEAAQDANDVLTRRVAQYADELHWIYQSMTWRLRQALLSLPGLDATYRWITRRNATSNESPPSAGA
ncbi:MAG: hypothetical protein AAGC60_15375 [Acidobacteriota bacterium]